VTFFAGNVPFGDLLGFEIVIQRMAAIAERARGALEIAGRIELRPPIAAVGNVVGKPPIVFDVPLRGQREIIIAAFGEVALLSPASINKSDLTEIEIDVRIRMREISENRFGMFLWIAHDVGHAGLFPALEQFFVALLAVFRADEV
jgi:hypothetical protein